MALTLEGKWSIHKFIKMTNLFKILLSTGLALTLASCGAMNDTYGNNYPNNGNNYPRNGSNNGNVYRAPDGNVYGRNEVYSDRQGNIYQNGRVVRTGDVRGNPGILNGNRNQNVYYPNRNGTNFPPGQAKKIYGGQSKDYAGGQQNKRNNQWKKNDNKRYDDYNRNDSRKNDSKEYRKRQEHNNKKLQKKYKDRDDD